MRMTLAFMGIVGVIMVAVVFSLATFAERVVDRQVHDMAGKINREVVGIMNQPARGVYPPGYISSEMNDQLVRLAQRPELTQQGILVAVVDTRNRNRDRLWTSSDQFPRRGERSRDYRIVFGGDPGRPGPPDPFMALLAIPSKQLDEFEAQRRQEFFGIVAIVLVLVAGGAYMLVGKTLSPIGQLSKQAAEASVDHLDINLNAPSQDQEIVELVDTLNGLLGRIAQTTASKGRFYSAASHELRTPLQALSGHLELALTRKRTAEEYETVLAEAHAQAVRLIDLTRNLLLLHQLDTTAPRTKDPVDLLSVCIGALSSIQPLISQRKLKIVWGAQEDAEILSIHSHTEILVRNLLENAVKYADEGSTVKIALTREDGRVVLTVENACAAASELSTEKLFEAFYRPDVSRNSRTGGNGLGLAICKAVASANGWTVSLTPKVASVIAEATFPVAEGTAKGPVTPDAVAS